MNEQTNPKPSRRIILGMDSDCLCRNCNHATVIETWRSESGDVVMPLYLWSREDIRNYLYYAESTPFARQMSTYY